MMMSTMIMIMIIMIIKIIIIIIIPMRAATPLTNVRVPKADVSKSTPRISTRAGGVTAHLVRNTLKSRSSS